MKNALLIALALTSISAFAGTKVNHKNPARKAAIESCKSEGKIKGDLKACVKEKLNTVNPTATK